MNELKIGIIGDFDEKKESHRATNAAIQHASDYLSLKADVTWIPTRSLEIPEGRGVLDAFDCIWAAPGSTHESREGSIRGIKRGRLMDKPFLGT